MSKKLLLAAALLLVPCAAAAHVTLGEPAALPGANYVAHFRVGHGCDGSPTTAISVALPPGISNPQAQPQQGWSVATVRSGGRIIAVTWKGGPLPATARGEFVMTMTLPRS